FRRFPRRGGGALPPGSARLDRGVGRAGGSGAPSGSLAARPGDRHPLARVPGLAHRRVQRLRARSRLHHADRVLALVRGPAVRLRRGRSGAGSGRLQRVRAHAGGPVRAAHLGGRLCRRRDRAGPHGRRPAGVRRARRPLSRAHADGVTNREEAVMREETTRRGLFAGILGDRSGNSPLPPADAPVGVLVSGSGQDVTVSRYGAPAGLTAAAPVAAKAEELPYGWSLRPGDLVVIDENAPGGPVAVTLHRNVHGTVTQVTDDSITVGGQVCLLDPR